MSEAMIILPGLMCDSRMFAAQVGAFDARVIDGYYGYASRLEAMADYALERMPKRAALFGHSMGARVALEIWRKAPERISRLALADTGVHPVGSGETEKRMGWVELGTAKGIDSLADAWLPPMLSERHRSLSDIFDPLRAMVVSAGTDVFAAQIQALLCRPEVEALLPEITCPTFLIVGEEDDWAPVEQHRIIASRIPGAQLRIIESAGHMAPAEQPARFNDALREWLAWPSQTTSNSQTERPQS